MAGRRGHSWSLSLSGAAAQRCCSSASRQAARRQAGRKGRVDALELIAQAAAAFMFQHTVSHAGAASIPTPYHIFQHSSSS
jgi:hypothetical protein